MDVNFCDIFCLVVAQLDGQLALLCHERDFAVNESGDA